MQQIGEVQACLTDPSLAKTEGDGIKSATVGVENCFAVVIMDPDGKPTNNSEDRLTVDIVSLSGISRVPVKVSCQQDGEYKVSYTPRYCGKYKVHVRVNAEIIAGSPRELTESDVGFAPKPKSMLYLHALADGKFI